MNSLLTSRSLKVVINTVQSRLLDDSSLESLHFLDISDFVKQRPPETN